MKLEFFIVKGDAIIPWVKNVVIITEYEADYLFSYNQ